jgi:hypothetical protein
MTGVKDGTGEHFLKDLFNQMPSTYLHKKMIDLSIAPNF